MLELQSASYCYRPGKKALDNITAGFDCGLTMLCGPNGSGKSTMLKLLAGELTPSGGSALLDGEEPAFMLPRRRAKKLAFVSQLRAAEYDFSVYEAVMMGRYSHTPLLQRESAQDKEAVEEALVKTGAAQFIKRSLRQLSGGELQRVFLARALAQQSPYLLLDEPITGLDIRFQHEFLRLTADLCVREGVCAVCVLHDLALGAQYSDRMALLSGGCLYALGRPEEILTSRALNEVFNISGGLFRHNGKYYLETDPV